MFMNCVSCGKSSLSIYSVNSYLNLPVYQCKDCSLLISGNSENQLKITLRNYYEKAMIPDEIKKMLERDHDTHHGRYLRNLWNSHYSYCSSYFHSSKNLLEIGPGSGLTLKMFDELGFNVIGIEQNKNLVQFINKKLKKDCCIQGYFEDIHFEKKFDVIWISHTFEHIASPNILLKKCKSLLQNDGFIFIAVPDCENMNTLKASIFENASSFHFTKKSLIQMATNIGFKIERCDSMRELVRVEGRFEMMLRKYLNFLSKKTCPYYPFKITSKKNGIEIRMILKNQ